jgi:hypothetical protein
MNNPRIKEKGGIVGTVFVRSHPAGTIEKWKQLMREGKVDEAKELLLRGKVAVKQRNLVVYSLNKGYDILVQYLLSGYTGIFNFPLGISWGEIGTGATQPTPADMALTTPTNRMPVSYGMDSGFNEAQLQFFFPDNVLPNGTYLEFGTFIGGSSTIGDGAMFNHALFTTPYTKSSGVDTTCEVDFSFAAQDASQFDSGQFT